MNNTICYRAVAVSLALFASLSSPLAFAGDINSSSSTTLNTEQMYFGTQESSGAISGSFAASSTAATNPPVMPPTHCEGAWHNGQSYTEWSACDFYGMSYRERTDRFMVDVFDMFGGAKCEADDGAFRVVQENTACLMNCVGAWDNPAWGAWSACSGGVKTSTRTLTYTITQPERNGGAACPATHGQTHIESQQTTAGCEPVPCAGSFDNPPWGAWGACVDGKKTRTRTLTYSINRYPENGGAACPHPNGFTKNESEQTTSGCVATCDAGWSYDSSLGKCTQTTAMTMGCPAGKVLDGEDCEPDDFVSYGFSPMNRIVVEAHVKVWYLNDRGTKTDKFQKYFERGGILYTNKVLRNHTTPGGWPIWEYEVHGSTGTLSKPTMMCPPNFTQVGDECKTYKEPTYN